MVKIRCFNVLALFCHFTCCVLLCMVLLLNIRSTFPPSLFSFTQVKYQGMYCTGIHFFFSFKDYINCNHRIFYSFIFLLFFSPTFYPFLIQELWICVYRIYNKKCIYHKELDVSNFESVKQRMYHIFFFEFNFKESLFTTFHLFIGQ